METFNKFTQPRWVKFLISAGGIYGSYIYYGLIQEKLYHISFKEAINKFFLIGSEPIIQVMKQKNSHTVLQCFSSKTYSHSWLLSQ